MPYTSYLVKQKLGIRRHDRDTRLQLARSFRALYRNLGMDLRSCAQFLHVSTRTVHNWESGKHDIPYATYKLLRLLNRMELPGHAWQGWCFYGNKLISPEGRSFEGKDSNWWGLLLMRARVNDRLRQRLGVEGAARTATGAAQADHMNWFAALLAMAISSALFENW